MNKDQELSPTAIENGTAVNGSNSINHPKRKMESNNDSEDDIPLSSRLKRTQKSNEFRPKSTPESEICTDKKPPPASFEAALNSHIRDTSGIRSHRGQSMTEYKMEAKIVKHELKLEKAEDSDDDIPLSLRKKLVTTKRTKEESNDDDEYRPTKKRKEKLNDKKISKNSSVKNEKESDSPNKKAGRKKLQEEEEIWKWWEEDKHPEGVKWKSLEHKGPMFAPAYEPLPKDIHFKYDNQVMLLSESAEEVATFYAKMLGHDYLQNDVFNNNFFKDWRKTMTLEEREKIRDLKKCDFKAISEYFQRLSEERKSMSKEEKQKLKAKKDAETKEYGFAKIDNHKQKIGNFRIEPPGLFRGRGEHPRMGKLKRRVLPEHVTINCSKNSVIPEPPSGHKWKKVVHDKTVTWLCAWTENVLNSNKYIMLNPSSKIKGEKDLEKYETARKLKGQVEEIRKNYTADLKSKEMRVRQRAVALYFIDKLALRAGNEKDSDEAADTVGCCSLRVEHITLHDHKNAQPNVVEFDFLGKDSIRYQNEVPVEKRVFKNVKLFVENKKAGDDLFDRLDTSSLNKHLQTIMPGLTAKVFRTFNASITLQDQLDQLTKGTTTVHDKMLSYNRANRQVAILCNHQRSIPKTHEKSMENLSNKIKEKKSELKKTKQELDGCRGDVARQKAKKKVERIKEQLKKLKIQRTDKDENKQIALGTSKLNYLDPRISVAWCRKNDVPIEKVYNKTQREKFRWAIDMTDQHFIF